jgi:hypothetical protein
VRGDLFGDRNNRKRYDGYVAALFDPEIWSAIEAREKKLRDAISRDSKLKTTLGAFEWIEKAQVELAKIAPRYDYLEQERPITVGYRGPRALYGTLFKYARLLTRALDERAKPNGERIAAFRDSAKESLELSLFSTEPVYDDYEILRLTDSLTDFAEKIWRQRSVGEAGSGREVAQRTRSRVGTRNKTESRRISQKSLWQKRGGAAGSA